MILTYRSSVHGWTARYWKKTVTLCAYLVRKSITNTAPSFTSTRNITATFLCLYTLMLIFIICRNGPNFNLFIPLKPDLDAFGKILWTINWQSSVRQIRTLKEIVDSHKPKIKVFFSLFVYGAQSCLNTFG